MLSCAVQLDSQEEIDEIQWKQIWQLAVRSISISSTCRAACVLLHAILEAHLIPLHTVADDIGNIVTMADICGPAVLVDSSLVLMHCLTNIRNELAPSAIQKTSSNIIRWVFSTWRPGKLSCVRSGLYSSYGQLDIFLINNLKRTLYIHRHMP